MNERMNNNQSSIEEANNMEQSIPLRLIGHMIFASSSFENLSDKYLILTSIIIILSLSILKVLNFIILISKLNIQNITEEIERSIMAFHFGEFISPIVSITLWSILFYATFRFFMNKVELKSILVFFISQIPRIIGKIILIGIILAAESVTITIEETQTLAEIIVLGFPTWALANLIIGLITTIYSFLIAGYGMSKRNKTSPVLGFIIGGFASLVYLVGNLFIF